MFVVKHKKWKQFVCEKTNKKIIQLIYDMTEKFEKNCRKWKEYGRI